MAARSLTFAKVPPTRYNACLRKHAFSRDKALRQADRERKRLGDVFITAYPCLYCDRWHIGHGRTPVVPVSRRP